MRICTWKETREDVCNAACGSAPDWNEYFLLFKWNHTCADGVRLGVCLFICVSDFPPFYRCQMHKRGTVYLYAVSFILFLSILWSGVVSANNLYLQRDLQDKARVSFLTRILYRLEEEPGFRENADSFAIIGASQGMRSSSASESFHYKGEIYYYQFDTFRSYCKHILDYDVPYCESDRIIELSNNPTVQKLSPYPNEGCVAVIDGVYVIKVADTVTTLEKET